MAIAFVRNAYGVSDGSTSIVATVPAAGFAAGNKLIVFAYDIDGGAFYSGVVDTAGNTYNNRHNYTAASKSISIFEADLTNALVSGNSVTGTQPTGGGAMFVCEFSGLATGNSLDKQANATSFDTVFSSGATATTTQADELLFGGVVSNSTTNTFAPDSPYVEIDERSWAGGTATAQVQYRIVSATGAYASTGTISALVTYIATIDTFKGAAAPPADTGLAWIRA